MSAKETILFLLISVLFSACKKDKITFDPVPSIEFSGISPANANEFSDHVIITIKYKDGDGDLGENSNAAQNCFVTDNRIGITWALRIQQLAPDGSTIPIEGTLNIDLGGQAITDSTLTQQPVNYTLYVQDRKGNRSNTVTSSSITIRK